MSDELLSEYRRLLTLSQSLAEAAKSGEWDAAIALEQARAEVVHKIETLGHQMLSNETSVEVASLIRDALACDESAKFALATAMGDLKELIDSTVNQRRLGDSYL
ncbi:flagellar protein FliT [Novimethylophilus kurashikiensis]|uniref:Flagellar protein FliT n=1 Tax=Novimethylophilus kurashikiensis TaxID=1825523 RepID=A0A2R5F3C0_9PROT|nr:flagellar protein FliT [Novimethylophilus kurashikiensis]GBG13002.1 flagellar protein FliT [Novimethylophilus kurashikiensis]